MLRITSFLRPIAFPNVHDIILINDSNRATNEVLLQTEETNIEFKTNMIAVVNNNKKSHPLSMEKKFNDLENSQCSIRAI